MSVKYKLKEEMLTSFNKALANTNNLFSLTLRVSHVYETVR